MSKIVFDDHTNLLRENYYEYDVQDVPEANLFPEIFNFDEIPKIAFNQRRVPMRMPTDIWITDTTFRDGQQSRAPFTAEQILRLFDMMQTQRQVVSAMLYALGDEGPGVLETRKGKSARRPARSIPERDLWFERVWRAYRGEK